MNGLLGLLMLLQMTYPSERSDTTYAVSQPVLKEVPPQVFIFKPGAGPYEDVSKEFGELGRFMGEKGISGQLAAVFYDDPAKVPADSLRWEVGIITNQPPNRTDPYNEKIISGRKAVSLMAENPPGQNRAENVKILNFIRQHRYVFRPPAMEILLKPAEAGQAPQTEILLPVLLKRRGQ